MTGASIIEKRGKGFTSGGCWDIFDAFRKFSASCSTKRLKEASFMLVCGYIRFNFFIISSSRTGERFNLLLKRPSSGRRRPSRCSSYIFLIAISIRFSSFSSLPLFLRNRCCFSALRRRRSALRRRRSALRRRR